MKQLAELRDQAHEAVVDVREKDQVSQHLTNYRR